MPAIRRVSNATEGVDEHVEGELVKSRQQSRAVETFLLGRYSLSTCLPSDRSACELSVVPKLPMTACDFYLKIAV